MSQQHELQWRRGMKGKTINAVIRKKVNDWLASIDDDEVREVAKKNTIVTGGCIASMLLGEKVNDFDIYFETHAAAATIAKYYVERFRQNPPTRHKDSASTVQVDVMVTDDRVKIMVKSAGIASEEGADDYQYFEGLDDAQGYQTDDYVEKVMNGESDEEEQDGKPPYRPVFLSANAITLSNKVQLVFRFFGEPDEIHKNYDFVHCTNYWTSWDNKLTMRPEALEALLARELVYVGSKYPLCSIIRTRKFIRRGWNITAGQYLKMAMQLNQLDLTDITTLEDQLIGVDTAYFNEILSKLKEKDTTKVDQSYLMTIIDRMF
jgi:hypothetical protein